MWRRPVPALILAVIGLAIVGSAAPAAAHGEEGVLAVVEAIPSDEGSSVSYRLALTYENDGDAVNGATVTATAFPASGEPSAPQALTGTGADGIYEGTVAFPEPGRWRVQFDVADPAAQLSVTYRVQAPAPPTTSATPPTTVPPPTSASAEPTLADDAGNDGSEAPVALFVGLAVAGLLFVGAAIYLIRRRAEDDG